MRGEDRLSSLPDELIHRILSFLELKMVIATSILSSRWRFLWTSVPTLCLYGDQEDSATSISLSLMNYTSPKIKKFLAQFDDEDVTDHHVALWIRFAVNRKVLSLLEAGRELPPFRTICLELIITLEKSDLTGMAHVMRSAPHLQTLILDVKSSPYPKDPLDTCDFDGLRKSLLLSVIHSLKTIRVNFRGSRLALPSGEPKPYLSVDEFLKNWEEEFKMLELLLNSCMVLEKMTIIIEKEYRTRKPWQLKSELLLAFQNRVLAVPTASSIVEICFSQNPVIV